MNVQEAQEFRQASSLIELLLAEIKNTKANAAIVGTGAELKRMTPERNQFSVITVSQSTLKKLQEMTFAIAGTIFDQAAKEPEAAKKPEAVEAAEKPEAVEKPKAVTPRPKHECKVPKRFEVE